MISRNFAICAFILGLSNLAQANDQALRDCLAQVGEVAPNAEALALAVSGALTKDKFLHRAYLSPMEYRMLDARKLAEMLVARLNEECEGPRTTADAEPVETEIIMMVPSNNLEAIAKFGFQNQHATGSTGGFNGPSMRFETEQNMMFMRMPYGAKMRDVLPKYSALDIKSSKFGSYQLPERYGDVALVFKSSTKNRTTFTFSDSLGKTALEEGTTKEFPPRTMQFKKSGDNDPEKNPFSVSCIGYCEAQIWGPLDLTDVDYLMVKKGAEIPDAAKKLGLPIYEVDTAPNYDESVRNRAAKFKRGELLFAAKGPVPVPAAYSKAQLDKEAEASPAGPAKNILEGRRLAHLSEKELMEQFAAPPPAASAEKKEEPVYFGQYSQKARIFSELATRPLTPELEKLLAAGVKNKEPAIRRAALLGLSDLPFDRFRPFLLAALKDDDNGMRQLAIAIGIESTDPEVRQALDAMEKKLPYAPYVTAEAVAQTLWKHKKYCGLD